MAVGKADVTCISILQWVRVMWILMVFFETLREMDFASKQLKPDCTEMPAAITLPAFPCLVFRKRWISRPRKQESGLRENCWGNDRVIAADQKENCNK